MAHSQESRENSQQKIDLSVIIPLYNEAESLPELYSRLKEVLHAKKISYELIFIDDGSQDGSFEILEKFHNEDKRVRVIQFRKNFGKSAGLACGFQEARGEIVITMDADLQDDPNEIPHLIEKINEGYDLVSGWKKKRYDPFIKRNTSKIYNFVTSLVSGIRLHDFNCGLKAYRKEVVKSIEVYGQLHRFIPVLAHWQGFRVTEIVVKHHPRKYGKTKFGAFRFIAGMLDLFTVVFLNKFKKRPLHLFGTLGVFVFMAGIIMNIYLAYQRIFFQKYLSNRPLLFLAVLLVIVGIQFISMGLLGEMITETQKRKNDYSVKRVLR